MATVLTQIRIDKDLKKQAVEVRQYKAEVMEAMEEAKRISKDPNTKRYSSFSEAVEDLDAVVDALPSEAGRDTITAAGTAKLPLPPKSRASRMIPQKPLPPIKSPPLLPFLLSAPIA